jgi:dTDP-4-dehydrorhamnose reductase
MKFYSPIEKSGFHFAPDMQESGGGRREKIWITGANGQLGNEFRTLAASYPQFDFLFTSRSELPIDDYPKLDEYFAANQPAYCINCAAYTAVDKAELAEEQHDVFGINADAVKMLAANCRENGTRLVHISTDYVFDGSATKPYKEDDPTNPVSAYGASKLLGEQYALQTDPGSLIIRSSWIYAAHGKNFVKTMLRLMSERNEINVVNDQVGSPTYAADLAEAIMHIIHSGTWLPGIYHYANAGAISWCDFALAIKELSGSNCKVHPIPSSQYPTPAKRPMYSVFDTTKIQQAFGIALKDWKESLSVCLRKIKQSAA